MADIVSFEELKTYLGDTPSSDDAALLDLLENVEAMYERATLRAPGYYTAAGTGRSEVLDGTGSSRLYLDYPITALTSVSLGYAAAETLNIADPSVLVYGVGSRVIARTDGGKFGSVNQPRYVRVVYDHQGNLPEDAKLPILEVVASMYRSRGSEGMRSETVGSFYSYTRGDAQAAAATNVNWQLSVAANTPVVVA